MAEESWAGNCDHKGWLVCARCGADMPNPFRDLSQDILIEDGVRQIMGTLKGEIPMPDKIYEAKTPPLGIIPERLWKEQRIWDLIECLARNREEKTEDVYVWLSELTRLLKEGVV